MGTPRRTPTLLRCEPLADRLAPGDISVVGDVAPSSPVSAAVALKPGADAAAQESSAAPEGSDRRQDPPPPPFVGRFETEILPDGSRVLVGCFDSPMVHEVAGVIVPPVSTYLLPEQPASSETTRAPLTTPGRPGLAEADPTS